MGGLLPIDEGAVPAPLEAAGATAAGAAAGAAAEGAAGVSPKASQPPAPAAAGEAGAGAAGGEAAAAGATGASPNAAHPASAAGAVPRRGEGVPAAAAAGLLLGAAAASAAPNGSQAASAAGAAALADLDEATSSRLSPRTTAGCATAAALPLAGAAGLQVRLMRRRQLDRCNAREEGFLAGTASRQAANQAQPAPPTHSPSSPQRLDAHPAEELTALMLRSRLLLP